MIERAEHSTSQLAVAFGAALLALAIAVTQVRLEDEWGSGVHLAIALVGAVGLLGAGLAARRLPDRPQAAASALLLAGLALWAIADYRFLEVISDTGDVFEGRRALTAFFALLALAALLAAARSGSAACLLVGALAVGGTVLAAVHWIFDTENVASYRPVLLVLAVAFAAGAFVLRARPRHRDVMVDAAGLAILSIAQLSGGAFLFFGFGLLPDAWEAVVLVAGLAIVGYAAVTRAPGPALLGLVVLAFFGSSVISEATFEETVITDDSGAVRDELNVVGWPLVLLGLSLAAFVFGMLRRGHDPDRAVH